MGAQRFRLSALAGDIRDRADAPDQHHRGKIQSYHRSAALVGNSGRADDGQTLWDRSGGADDGGLLDAGLIWNPELESRWRTRRRGADAGRAQNFQPDTIVFGLFRARVSPLRRV